MTLPLIDKQDNFEIIRDQIAAILAVEIAEQQLLAAAASEDPTLWRLRIFRERSNPWEQFKENDPADESPIVNVSYDGASIDRGASDPVEKQTNDGVFNIDCYALGVSSPNATTGGHNPGDREAALASQRALRLVRNILMAGAYTYLDLRGIVSQRMPQALVGFQPQLDNQAVQNVMAARLALQVRYIETSPQNTGDALELVSTLVRRTEDGEIVIEADYPYP